MPRRMIWRGSVARDCVRRGLRRFRLMPCQFVNRRQRKPQDSPNCPNAFPFGAKSADRLAVDIVARRPPQADASRFGGPQSCIDPFPDDFALEFRHGHQDTQLQPACRVVVARVDPLTRANERHAMRGQLRYQLGEMRQASAKPVQLEADNHVQTPPPNVGHEPVKALPGELGAADDVPVLGDARPSSAPAVVVQFGQLAVV